MPQMLTPEERHAIVTETLKRSLDPRFVLRPLPTTRVKGVEQPLEIYAVDGAA